MKRISLILLLCVTLMTSCNRESDLPTPTTTSISLNGQWFNDPQNVYAQSDTTVVTGNGNNYTVTELDYVIYQSVTLSYNQANNTITLQGSQGQYTVEGTGYLIGNDTLHLDYTVTPGMTTEMHSNWYRQ